MKCGHRGMAIGKRWSGQGMERRWILFVDGFKGEIWSREREREKGQG